MLLLVSILTLVFGDLSGKYTGSKTIVGVTITETMTFKDGMKVDFSFTGPLTINCPDEDYTLGSDGTLTLTNLNTPGDCLEKNLDDNDVTLESIIYSANDEITISFKWKFLSQSIVLQRETNTFPDTILATALSGEYSVAITTIGDEIIGSITFSDDMTAEVRFSVPLTIDCREESYSIAADGTISMTNIDVEGDCLHETLSRKDVTLKGIKYSSDPDTITVTVEYYCDKFLIKSLTLSKVSKANAATKPTGKYTASMVAPVEKRPIKIVSNREYRENVFKSLHL